MGATSIYGLRYQDLGSSPDGADLGKDLAEDVEAELDRIDDVNGTQASSLSSQSGRITALENFDFQFIRKTADETVTSNITPQLDNHLFFSGVGSQRYLVKVVCFVQVAGGNSGVDFRASFLMPALAAASFGGNGPDPAMGSGTAIGQGQWLAQYGSSTSFIPFGLYNGGTTKIEVEGIVTMGVSSGTVTFAWSQDVASANGVTLLANSYMKVNKIS